MRLFHFSATRIVFKNRILDTAFPETKNEVKRTVAIYKTVRSFLMGDFCPLFPHDSSEKVWYDK